MRTRNFFLLAAVLIMSACQNDSVMEVLENEVVPMEEQKPVYTTKVTMEDVKHLAGVFNAGKATTKADARTVGSVTTLTDDAGNPAIYVVNYADNKGFVLVSATKNYHPVLAYNDEGNFNLFATELPGALENWIANKKADVAYADQLPEDSTYWFRATWSEFEAGKSSFVPRAATRSANNSALDSYVMSMTSQWIAEGKEYYSLSQAGDILPSDIYSSWCAIAEGAVYPSYEDYMTYTFVVQETVDTGNAKKNTFLPNWQQRNGYNALMPLTSDGSLPPAGCATIAMAQVLRHYARPIDKYPWDEMPYETPIGGANTATADLVRDIASNINATSTATATSASLGSVKTSFYRDFSYDSSIELINHNIVRTRTEIDNNRPVIMQGFRPDNVGHAWVVSGYERNAGHIEYKLWVPVNDAEVTDPYTQIETYSTDYSDYTHIYIHWGWGSGYNGYFLDSNISIDGDTYNSTRKDIVNLIPPVQ